jgi:F-type H+-transporting ATPase subunit epsilon
VATETVSRVALPGVAGPFVVLKDHAPLVTALTEGEIVYGDGMEDRHLPVKGGFVEVFQNQVTVCAELK